MKSNATNMLRTLPGLTLWLSLLAGVAIAQTPSPSPTPSPAKPAEDSVTTETPEPVGNFDVISSLEFGYRGLEVVGDLNKYQSDLNYRPGPRVFDSSFLMRAKNGKGPIDTMMVTSTGWGA